MVDVWKPPYPSELWQAAHQELLEFLEARKVTASTTTTRVELTMLEIETAATFESWLARRTRSDGHWAFATFSVPTDRGARRRVGLALPIREGMEESLHSILFPYVDIHTSLTAWWLLTAWRARQLAEAALHAAREQSFIAASACARPLVETAAAFWQDAIQIEGAWAKVKAAGEPVSAHWASVLQPLVEALEGAFFKRQITPDLWETYKTRRTNVLTQVEGLGDAGLETLHEDYAWLCNTVHPSLGTIKTFSTPPQVRSEVPTYSLTLLAGGPLLAGDPSKELWSIGDRTIQSAVDRACSTSLHVLQRCMAAMLSTIDDVGLVTRAPELSRWDYWRQLVRPKGLSDLCPCESGLTWEKCQERVHRWSLARAGYTPVPRNFGESN